MKPQEKGIFGQEQNQASLREFITNYFKRWPLFLGCLVICIGAGILYTRYAIPKFLSSTSFLVKEATDNKSRSNDLIDNAFSGKSQINLNSEILQFGSTNLMEHAIAKNQFNISYLIKGRVLNVDVYKEAPFTLQINHLSDSNLVYKLEITDMDSIGGILLYESEKKENPTSFKWNIPFNIKEQVFVLNSKVAIKKSNATYIVVWDPVSLTANQFSKDLALKAFDNKTSVIEASIKTANLQKGKDVLNSLFTEFNLSDIEDRNKLSASTVQFIDERLFNISAELKGVEGSLEQYQGSNQLVDIKSQSTQSLENSSLAAKTIKDLGVQQGIVAMIQNYFSKPANGTKLVPSSLGLNDGTLSLLINQYNELQLKREREMPLVAPNSTVMQDLNTQISSIKSSMLESLSSIDKNLRLQLSSFEGQNNKFQGFLSSVPHNERVMQEIKRKQGITEGLYLYLLQKREEAAISSTANNVAHYKQIDLATGYGPVEPNKLNIILYTTLLGLFLAFGWIYLEDILNDKIRSRQDINKKLSLSIIGDINHASKKKKQVIAVLDRSIISEQFRTIRTNLSFLLKNKKCKTILVTSSNKGEGKSFVSINLAAVHALTDKKVALLEFDVRMPVISELLNIKTEHGLVDYLTGKQWELTGMYQRVPEIPSLHIFPCGPVPANPGDLLLSDNLSGLFEQLKLNYEYIIIDTPPTRFVSDPFILEKYSDAVIYVIRQNFTLKKHLDFITEIASDKTLSNISVILNDIKQPDNDGYGVESYK